MKKAFGIICFVMGLVVPAAAQTPSRSGGTTCTIAENGQAKCVIVQGASATKAEHLAVTELALFLGKISGASFAVQTETPGAAVPAGIYVGWTDFARRQGIDAEKLGEEEWIIRTDGKNLIITGGRLRGTLYGVYEFLENRLGCHWLTWDTEVVPRGPNLTVADLNLRGKPAFVLRDIYTTFGDWQSQEKKDIITSFHYRNRQQNVWDRDIGGFIMLPAKSMHCFYIYLNPKEYFAAHPEYFSMGRDGKRTAGNYEHVGGAGSQLCLSNPEVARITAENMSAAIKQQEAESARQGWNRKYRIAELTQEDNASFLCLCPECKEISEREGSESGLLIQFVNRVAELLSKEYPDIKLRTLAYVSADKPPRTVRPRDNVIVQVCDLYGKSDCFRPLTNPVNRDQAEMIRGWAKIAVELHLWDYWDMGSQTSAPGMPAMISAETIAADMRFFRENRVTGVFIENEAGVTQQSFYDLSVWAGLQLLDNPDLSADKLATTFINGYYGPAAKPMRDYYDLLAATMLKEPTPMFRPAVDTRLGLSFLNMDFLVRCRKLLVGAEAATAPKSPEQMHVWRELIVVDKCLLHHWSWLQRQAKRDFPFKREAIIDEYETIRPAEINYQYTGKKQTDLNGDLRQEMAVLKTVMPLPEQFRNLPADQVMDFGWPKMAPWDVRDEPEASGGRALSFDKQDLAGYAKPITVGIYDRFGKKSGPSIAVDDIPADEKYHLYKIGQFSLSRDTCVWVHPRWLMAFDLGEAYMNTDGVEGPDPNLWEVYISLKLIGPAYVPASLKTNAIWVDRILLVKPGK
jgi:hypothetical protein